MVCVIGSREQHNVRALFSATHCFFWRRLLQTWEAFSVLSDQVGRLCLLHISTRLLTGPLYTTFGMASSNGSSVVRCVLFRIVVYRWVRCLIRCQGLFPLNMRPFCTN